MYNILKELSELAHRELNENGNISYTMPNKKYHLFIYVDDSLEDMVYTIEPYKIVNNTYKSIGDETFADYNNFEELLLGCVWCITNYFI